MLIFATFLKVKLYQLLLINIKYVWVNWKKNRHDQYF